MSVRMTNCGALGWITTCTAIATSRSTWDRRAVAADLDLLLAAWRAPRRIRTPRGRASSMSTAPTPAWAVPDRDEADLAAPVVSLARRYRPVPIGGQRKDPTRSLASGDACVLAGAARLAFHGVDRITPGTSTLLPEGGRINLTMRRVTLPE